MRISLIDRLVHMFRGQSSLSETNVAYEPASQPTEAPEPINIPQKKAWFGKDSLVGAAIEFRTRRRPDDWRPGVIVSDRNNRLRVLHNGRACSVKIRKNFQNFRFKARLINEHII